MLFCRIAQSEIYEIEENKREYKRKEKKGEENLRIKYL